MLLDRPEDNKNNDELLTTCGKSWPVSQIWNTKKNATT